MMLLSTGASAQSAAAAQGAKPAATDGVKASTAARLPAGVVRVTSAEGIDEYRLSNGLKVLLYPDASKPTVTVNITYLVGSRHENYGETGMAHLLEHLIFKGSKNYPRPDREFNARGFRNNGSTWLDRTNYFSTFKASDDNLRWAIGWSADAMTQSFIARKDLDTEFSVVRNEYESGENRPTSVLFKRMQSIMFDWHNYGNSTIGNRSDIENVRIENLQAFYRTYYQPDNAVLVVAGNFDAARTLGWIAQAFGPIPAPKRVLPTLWTVEPTQDGERSFVVRRAGDVQIIMLGYRIASGLSRDAGALQVAAEVLSDTPNGRLHKELVASGLATQVFSQLAQPKDPGFALFGAIIKQGDDVGRVRDRLIEVVEGSLTASPPTAEELDRVRRASETDYERTLADPESVGVTLSESIANGDWRLFFVNRDAILQADAAAVQDSARRYFRRDNRTVGTFLPEPMPQRAEIPAPLSVADLLKDFKPRATVAAGEVFDPSQENIDRRTRRVQIGDLKLALLSKRTRGETVNVATSFRFGDERSLNGKAVVSQLVSAMLTRGTDRLTRQQIADEFTRLKINGGVQSFETSRATLAEALTLVAHLLRNPAFPAAEFDQLKRELITGLEAQINDPSARARDAMLAHFNTYPPGDPRYYLPLQQRIEAIAAVTLDDLRQFHRDFWGTARGEVAVVGDFDDKAIEALIVERFGQWRSAAPYARILSEPRPVPAVRRFIATADKENATLQARLVLDLRDDDADAPALLMANAIFGAGSGLSNRLAERLRQKDGISYGVGSNLSVGGRDRAASWSVGAIAAAGNVSRAEVAIREELDRFLRDGVTPSELERARAGLLQERSVARSDDGTLANAWLNLLDLDRTFAFSRGIEDRLRALTPEQLATALRKAIDPSRLSVFVAGDPAKGAK